MTWAEQCMRDDGGAEEECQEQEMVGVRMCGNL